MANMDTLRQKVAFHIRDISFMDSEIEQIILQVITDIAMETKLFKKLVGFTIHEDIVIYDFRNISRLNEQVEEEVQSISIGDPSRAEMLKFLLTGDFPNPTVTKANYIEVDHSTLLDVMSIYDEDGIDISHKFQYHGTMQYFCRDDEWRRENEAVAKAAVVSVIPDIDELLPEDLLTITAAVIEGCKYYFSDTMQDGAQMQTANLYYQRYFQKKNILINKYPTQIVAIRGKKQWP